MPALFACSTSHAIAAVLSIDDTKDFNANSISLPLALGLFNTDCTHFNLFFDVLYFSDIFHILSFLSISIF